MACTAWKSRPRAVRDLAGNSLTGYVPLRFHRLFGDIDGDRDVDSVDLRRFRTALNRPSAYTEDLDYNGDGLINLADYDQLRLRMARRILR